MRPFHLFTVLLLAGCAGLPPIYSSDCGRSASIERVCESFFPTGRWQMVHTIQAVLPGGRQAVFSGVVVLSVPERSIHCVLMTLEGFVLFEALDDGRVTVKRAVGPFDNDHFARAVMADIRFLFLEPVGGITTVGEFEDGTCGCRYQADPAGTVDVVQPAGGEVWMRQYDRRGRVLRSLTAKPPGAGPISPRIVMDAAGRRGYRLSMTLVEAIARP